MIPIIIVLILIIIMYRGETRYLGGSSYSSYSSYSNHNNPSDDFIDAPYGLLIDDPYNKITTAENQAFLTKDYAKNIEYAFPHIDGVPPTLIEGKNYDNQALSYMMKNVVGERFITEILKPLVESTGATKFIDATAGIGGVSLRAALAGIPTISYELDPKRFEMLTNNIALYNLPIKALNEPFGPHVDVNNSIVMIDPPYEQYSGESGRFNFSIENRPIYYLIDDLLTAGARAVIIDTPLHYLYNSKFASDHNQDAKVIRFKKIKFYILRRKGRGDAPRPFLLGDVDK